MAEESSVRRALWQITEAVADLWGDVMLLVPDLRRLPSSDGPRWDELMLRWK